MTQALQLIGGILLFGAGVVVLIRRRTMAESILRIQDPLFRRTIRRRKSQQIPIVFLGVTMLVLGAILAFR